MKQIVVGVGLLALLLVVAGCPNPQKVTELEAQVQAQTDKIAELEGQVQQLTVERDSLMKVIADMVERGGSTTPRGTTPPPEKPPRTGR